MDNNYRRKFSVNEKKRMKVIVIVIITLIIVIIALSTSFFTVNEKQQAVITTFGKYTDTVGAGIHFIVPFGIQDSIIVDSHVIQQLEIGYSTDKTGNEVSVSAESKMITGDFNIVNVDFFVEYQISEPYKFLYASMEPKIILKNLIQSHIRNVISSYNVDDILTVGKSLIQSKIKENIIEELKIYDIGIVLSDIKIQDAEPPTDEVISAFKSVETSKQDKETMINEALAYENQQVPLAEAEEDKLIKNADYLKQNRINEANKQVVMFEAMYSLYKVNPLITKERMYFEMIERTLPNVNLYINSSSAGNSNTEMLLPLDSFNK